MSDDGAVVPGFGARREAREDALAVLYEAEISGDGAAEALARREAQPSLYARELALGVDADRAGIDDLLGRSLLDWRVERLAVIDRVVARMAVWELLNRPDVPTGVVLSEAVALATQYSSAEAPRFLNGVLRAVADQARDH
ncbi:MAG: transcription antitermination factor NusB [Acidimicrobiaceae bacterium]|nr:transcription antitermination factor NusB [Acidimicrobiaceae bacterium]MCY4279713.1 transcription antitermination factor NusB [Acidimicrobiaceae bacterium]MCY4294968.1 transcription antitermination factor NusB [Acidimicrobiaceae bacterium]